MVKLILRKWSQTCLCRKKRENTTDKFSKEKILPTECNMKLGKHYQTNVFIWDTLRLKCDIELENHQTVKLLWQDNIIKMACETRKSITQKCDIKAGNFPLKCDSNLKSISIKMWYKQQKIPLKCDSKLGKHYHQMWYNIGRTPTSQYDVKMGNSTTTEVCVSKGVHACDERDLPKVYEPGHHPSQLL